MRSTDPRSISTVEAQVRAVVQICESNFHLFSRDLHSARLPDDYSDYLLANERTLYELAFGEAAKVIYGESTANEVMRLVAQKTQGSLRRARGSTPRHGRIQMGPERRDR